jgi:hypothetical protein
MGNPVIFKPAKQEFYLSLLEAFRSSFPKE